MAFLKVPTKTILVWVDDLPRWWFHPDEIKAIMKMDGFYAFAPKGGYYIKKEINIVDDKD